MLCGTWVCSEAFHMQTCQIYLKVPDLPTKTSLVLVSTVLSAASDSFAILHVFNVFYCSCMLILQGRVKLFAIYAEVSQHFELIA